MNKNKPRGSQEGLLKNREATRIINTEAMWQVINRLRKENANRIWTYKEVWSSAGLKSSVALNSPWNSHIRDAITTHNTQIKENAANGPLMQSQRKTLRDSNRILRDKIINIKKERDSALSKIAIFEADAIFYKNQFENQLKITERLRTLLDNEVT
jgi:hypothetical protein